MWEAIKATIMWIVGYVLTLLVIVYAWLALFVLLLGYDFVTTASILFSVFLVGVAVGSGAVLWRAIAERRLVPLMIYLADIVLMAGFVTAASSVFSLIHQPAISGNFDMPAAFWGVVGAPILMTAEAIGRLAPNLGDLVMGLINMIEQSTVLSQATAALLAGGVSALISQMRPRTKVT